jgi:peptide/nickel transport system permease protein
MQAYVLRRLLALIPTLFFASLIVFVTVRLIPGDVIDLMLSQNDISASKLSRDQLVSGRRPRGRVPSACGTGIV